MMRRWKKELLFNHGYVKINITGAAMLQDSFSVFTINERHYKYKDQGFL